MKINKTAFTPNLVIALIQDLAEIIPGVNKIEISPSDIDIKKRTISFIAVLSNELINIKPAVFELQKLIAYNMSQKTGAKDYLINIQVKFE